MSDRVPGDCDAGFDPEMGLDLEFDLDAPPEKVWRALSLAEFRARWMPGDPLAGEEVVSLKPGREARYRMREPDPPFLESVVTFRIAPNGGGGTRLRILHELTDARLRRAGKPPTSSDPCLMLAA